MSDQVTIARDIMELTDTIQAGLEHLGTRMAEGYLEDTEYLFADILTAIGSIFNAIAPFIADADQKLMEELKEKLLTALEGMCAYYENKNLELAKKNLQFVLNPTFQIWHAEMKKCLRPWLES